MSKKITKIKQPDKWNLNQRIALSITANHLPPVTEDALATLDYARDIVVRLARGSLRPEG